MRTTVTIPSGGDTLEAWFYRPDESVNPPVIVMAHGVAGTKEMRLDVYAEKFTAAGYACLVFDYRHFGGSTGTPRQLLSPKKQTEDWRAALTYARSLPDVDAARVVAWGTSFGGGNVIRVAAEGAPLAAVIAQCPFTDGWASVGKIPVRTTLRLVLAACRDLLASRKGAAVHVPASGRPGDVALMSASDTHDGVKRLTAGVGSFSNEVTARSALLIATARPGRRAKNIRVPLFAALCESDTVAPAATAQKHISRAPAAEIHLYDSNHFDIYLGEAFTTASDDMLTFLRKHVPPHTIEAT
jgi:dienelactone hydrolase